MNRKILVLVTFSALTLLTSCHIARYFYWNFADINDWKKFPALPVDKGEKTFYFSDNEKQFIPVLPDGYPDEQDFDAFLDDHKTAAFLIIRNDTILYEKYFDGFSDTSILPSFSVSKSYVSALMGIAIKEGYIQSTLDPVTKYIPELLKNDPDFEKIRIEDLLNMRSGIRYNEGYTNPFAEMPKFYYGKNLARYITKLKIDCPPDQKYDYISVNTLLLGMAIERSTGKDLSQYLSEKIWSRIGMEYDASWNVDSKKHGQIKHFCCINARTHDYAKFGRLFLNNGKYNGEQIIPEDWVNRTASVLNNSKDSQQYNYTYQWRVKEDGSIFAKGILGQYIYVDPTKKIIIVRLGKSATDLVWADFFEKICQNL